MSYYLRDGDGLGVFSPPSRPAFENCNPLDSACVARNQVLSDAYDLAMAQAQAQNNIDQCMENAKNATPGAQYEAAVAACHGQYQSQSPTGQSYVSSVNPPSPSGGQLSFTSSRGAYVPGGTTLQVGDTWHLSITGATPNAPVTVSGSMPSGGFSNTPMGTTDSSGNFSKAGTLDSSAVGPWVEYWAVGGVSSGGVAFNVVPATASTGSAPTPPVNPPASSGSSSGASSSSTVIAGFDLSSIPTWGWLAAAAGVAFFAFGGGRGR
jgi:hypothetical protein